MRLCAKVGPATSISPSRSAFSLRIAPRVGVVSLGCPKALVDSERIMTRLRAEGYDMTGSAEKADVVIVNTCGFLDSAKEESLDAIGQAMRENGRVIVTGCMGAQPDLIRDKFPNLLAVTGPHQYEQVVEAVHEAVPPLHDPFVDLVPPEGLKLTPRHYAYLKISEGCNNRCTFCIIPTLRGDLVSRPVHHVLHEAENLVRAGVKEILSFRKTPAPMAWIRNTLPARGKAGVCGQNFMISAPRWARWARGPAAYTRDMGCGGRLAGSRRRAGPGRRTVGAVGMGSWGQWMGRRVKSGRSAVLHQWVMS